MTAFGRDYAVTFPGSTVHVQTHNFPISAMWDEEASVWSGRCDDIPAAADAASLDELLAKMSVMAVDVLPDNHPNVDPTSVYLQITALQEAKPMPCVRHNN